MLFDTFNSDFMMNMHDLNPFFWVPMSIGGVCVLVVIIVIIYFLSRNNNYNKEVNTKQQQLEQPPIREQNNTDKIIQFCPDCGAKLQGIHQEYCSLCGFKLKY